MKKCSLTIAICTYNRANIISECLASLNKQTVDSTNYTLLVIDNNSADNTKEIVSSFKDKFSKLVIISEHAQGLSHARNRALEECETEWLAFLDDDAKAHPNWVSTILETIQKDDFDAFGGPYYAWHHYGPAPRWFPDNLGTYESPQGYGLLTGDTYIPGGNSIIRCAAARATGTFSTKLGMNGKHCGYGEETQFFERMRAAGYRLGYVPHLKIDHCVLPYKYRLQWQICSAFAYGKAEFSSQKYSKRFILLRCLWHYCKSFYAIIRDVISLRASVPIGKIIFKNTRPLFFDAGFLYAYISKIKREYKK